MKKYYRYILAAAAIAFGLTACHKEAEYEPGAPDVDGCYGVYFPSQAETGFHIYSPAEDPVTEITVKRTLSKGAIDVPFVAKTSDEDAFSIGKIHFDDGQEETTLTIDFSKSEIAKEYALSVSVVDEQYASKYNNAPVSFDFSFMRVEYQYVLNPKTEEPAIVTFEQPWWAETATARIKYYELNGIRYCQTETLSHVSEGEEYTGYGFFGTGTKDDYAELNFLWYTDKTDIDGNQFIELPLQQAMYVNGAQRYMFDYIAFLRDWKGESVDWISEALSGDYLYGYYDGNGGFYFYVYAYISLAGSGWSVDAIDFYGIADGFTRVDYSIEAELDYSVDGVLPVYFELGADVNEIRFAGFEGELSKNGVENAVASITSDEEGLNIVTVSKEDIYEYEEAYYADSAISFEKTGTYTIVAVAYDAKGEVQNYTSVAGPFVAEGDIEENAVNISVGTETTSERYAPESDASNSFGFWIVGEDIKAVNYTIVTTASFEKNADVICSGVKYGAEGSVVLEAGEIEEVNAEGGYTELASGLNALTGYTLVVWATNGVSDTVVTAEYTTEGLPNEIIADGTFSYVYTIYNTNYDPSTEEEWDRIVDGMSLEYNPNTDCYEIPEWYGDVTLRFKYDKESGEISVPMQGVENLSAYGYGVVFVTDPSALPQDFIDYFEINLTPQSYVDEDGIFHFYVSYASTAGYYMGTGYEHFGPSEAFEVEAEATAAAPVQRSFRKFEGFSPVDCRFGVKYSAYERDPQPVAIKVVDAPRRTFAAKESLRGSERTVETRKF